MSTSSWTRRLELCAAMVLWSMALPGSVLGQVVEVRARVVDEPRRSPLEDARVALLSPDSTEVASTASGPDGFFLLSAPSPGTYLVRVEVGGYEVAVRPVEFGEGQLTLPAFVLEPNAIPIEGMDVEVQGRRLPGRITEPSARPIHVLSGARLAELERAGVSFTGAVNEIKAEVRVGTYQEVSGGRHWPCIESRRTLPRFEATAKEERCRWVDIVVDGVNTYMSAREAARFVKSLHLRDWESIEFLTGASAMRYGLGDRGALVLWTRGHGPHASQAREGGG